MQVRGVVGLRWRELGVALDAIAMHPAIAERIVERALDAFRAQRRWIQVEDHGARVAI